MYKVYKVEPRRYYHGMSLVAAESAVEANSIITEFKIDSTDRWRYIDLPED